MLLHEHQRIIAQNTARFKVIRGGRRGGKTKLETENMMFKACSGENRIIFYVAPNQVQARQIIWESLKQRNIDEHGQPIGVLNEQRLELYIPATGSMIKVAGWENKENFRGQSAFHITFDETDTMRDFFIGWQEVFAPALIDTKGTCDFIGTPKKENPNLRRLEKEAQGKLDWACFTFSSWDNPSLDRAELQKWKEDMDADTYRQEIMAEYVDNAGSLFKYTALIDLFSNTITKTNEKYLIVDIADDGSDKTVFSFWNGLELYRIELFERLNTESIINTIREYASAERIPYSRIAVDAIGVGAGVATSSLLDGITGFKSSYQAIKTDHNPVLLPNVHYRTEAPLTTEYRNLRSQCIFTLADLVNNHKLAVRLESGIIKEKIIEELALYQDASLGDGKRQATQKDDIKALLGRSPDISDTLIMRMYFEIRERMLPNQSEQAITVHNKLVGQFTRNEDRYSMNSTK